MKANMYHRQAVNFHSFHLLILITQLILFQFFIIVLPHKIFLCILTYLQQKNSQLEILFIYFPPPPCMLF